MAGVIFLVISVLFFIGLYFYIKKSDSVNHKEIMDELYNKPSKKNVKVEVNENKTEVFETAIDESDEEEYEEYTYDSYKSDEEYLRVARLVKNIYYVIVCVVLMVLGILYIVMFKL